MRTSLALKFLYCGIWPFYILFFVHPIVFLQNYALVELMTALLLLLLWGSCSRSNSELQGQFSVYSLGILTEVKVPRSFHPNLAYLDVFELDN